MAVLLSGKKIKGLIVLLIISATETNSDRNDDPFMYVEEEEGLTYRPEVEEYRVAHTIEEVDNVAGLGDAQHRGPEWYSDPFSSEYSSEAISASIDESEHISFDTSESTDTKSCSSQETDEDKRKSRVWRSCVPCYEEMMKSYKNVGIKWICGAYQRARRTFKSECMMRYRNCQDGTMFQKISDHQCQNNTYHGHHWFYVYKV